MESHNPRSSHRWPQPPTAGSTAIYRLPPTGTCGIARGDPDGGHAVEGSVVYVPCPNGVTAVKVLAKPPYLKQLWTDNDGAAGGPIIADGLVWTIAGNDVHGLNPANGDEIVSIPFGGYANHFPTPSVGDGLLLLPGTDQVLAFMGPAGLPPPPPAS